ncbi:hypothetical protein CY35_07G123100, partial [Sphagnum magellanicum]
DLALPYIAMGYRMSKHASLFHFALYFLLFGRHPIPPSSIVVQMDQVMDLDSPTTWAKVIAEKVALFRKVKQFDVGDFVCLQRQPNDILDTSFGRTILRIKAIKHSGVLELQGANRCTIQDHSKNCAPCHLPNLNPTIIMLTWIPPLDYLCQMLFCDNYNGGYHLFYLKPELTQVPTDIWYCSSCFPTAP